MKQAFVEALNQLTDGSEAYLSILQENMADVISGERSDLAEEIQRKLDVLQKKLVERAEQHEDYENIAQEIFQLREQKEQVLRENVSQQEQKDRIRELQEFLMAQPHQIAEFDETLVRHLLAKITVFQNDWMLPFDPVSQSQLKSESLQGSFFAKPKAGEDLLLRCRKGFRKQLDFPLALWYTKKNGGAVSWEFI